MSLQANVVICSSSDTVPRDLTLSGIGRVLVDAFFVSAQRTDEIQTDLAPSSGLMSFQFPAAEPRLGKGELRAANANNNANRQQGPASDRPDRTYYVGPENQLVPVVIDDFLKPEAQFTPVVIYGPVGSGKSHLAELIAAKWNAQQAVSQHKNARATSAGKSTTTVKTTDAAQVSTAQVSIVRATDLVPSGRGTATQKLNVNAAAVIFLNVDDLGRNPRWQRRMAALLDDWQSSGCRVLITSRKHPAEIGNLDARLRSRLLAGLCVGLEPPALETRQALVRHWAQQSELAGKVRLTASGVRELASQVEGVPSRLRGAFWQLALSAQSEPGPRSAITAADVREFLNSGAAAQSKLTVALIGRTTARHFGTTLTEIRGPSRRKSLVLARSIAMYLARNLAGKSLAEIGKWFGGRDHTTVLHSCRKIEADKDTRPEVSEALQQLTDLLRVGV